jgi:hypothetical protein
MTTISASTVVAQAWRFMELSPISSFGDDTEQARSSLEQYPIALAECLAKADWSFASVLVNLPEAVLPQNVANDPELPHFYGLPGDMVRIHEVGDGTVKWRKDRDGLRAEAPAPLRVRYTAMITNEAILPGAFQTAVALRLAHLLGPRWLGTQSKLQDLDRRFQMEIKNAQKQDARSASAVRYDLDAGSSTDWASGATW